MAVFSIARIAASQYCGRCIQSDKQSEEDFKLSFREKDSTTTSRLIHKGVNGSNREQTIRLEDTDFHSPTTTPMAEATDVARSPRKKVAFYEE